MGLLESQVRKVNAFILVVKDQKVIVVRLDILQFLGRRAKKEIEP